MCIDKERGGDKVRKIERVEEWRTKTDWENVYTHMWARGCVVRTFIF